MAALIRSFAVALLILPASQVEAKPAQCMTTDDGRYPCDFRAIGRDGSFEISAPGKPTYILEMIELGVAAGFVNFGDRNINLPGRYLRSQTDRACWVNDSTGTMICAW